MATPLLAKEQGATPRRPSTEGSVAAAPSARSQGEHPRAPKRPQESYNGPSPNKRAAPDLSSPHSQCVKIYIGDDKSAEPFIIHRPFIFHHSPYFEKVFKELDDSLFVGDGMPSTVYKETNRDAFGLFMRYIYRGTIKDNNNNNPPVKHTVQLWVLAGKIATPALQNAAMESIFENKCVVGVASLLYIYENTEHGSPLRRLAIDQGLIRNCTMESLLSIFRDHLVNLPSDLLADMIVAQKKLLAAGAHLPPCRIADYYVRVIDRRV